MPLPSHPRHSTVQMNCKKQPILGISIAETPQIHTENLEDHSAGGRHDFPKEKFTRHTPIRKIKS